MDKRPRRNRRVLGASTMDMREFIGVKAEAKSREKKPYYEIRARVIVRKNYIDVTAVTDMRNNISIAPVMIYVISHDHDKYMKEYTWHLYDGVYKIARILRDKVIVRIIEVKNGEARVIREYVTN